MSGLHAGGDFPQAKGVAGKADLTVMPLLPKPLFDCFQGPAAAQWGQMHGNSKSKVCLD